MTTMIASLSLILFLLLTTASITTINSYKILIYSPQTYHSHVTFMGAIADVLVSAGHDVVMYLPQTNPLVTTNGTKLARVRLYKLPIVLNALSGDDYQKSLWHSSSTNAWNIVQFLRLCADQVTQICEYQISDRKLIAELRAEKFDLALSELWDPCGFGIFELVNVPSHIACLAPMAVDSLWLIMGVPSALSYAPGVFTMSTDRMSYRERVTNVINYVLVAYYYHRFLVTRRITSLFRSRFGADFIDIDEKLSRSAFAFVNNEELIDYPRPISHRIIYINGVGVAPVQPLNGEIKSIVDKANRIILVSFGSLVETRFIPDRLKRAFIAAFSHFGDIDFIWKDDGDDNGNIPMTNATNVHRFGWIPQNDLLNEDKVIAMLTHAGLNSITEAIRSGTPMITMPLLGDQMRNAKMIESRQLGIILDPHDDNIDAHSIIDAIRTVIDDQKYTENAKRLAHMIRRKPTHFRQQIIKYSEFAAEFGPSAILDPYGRRQSFIEYHLIDVFAPVFGFLSLFAYLLYRLISNVVQKLYSRKSIFIEKLMGKLQLKCNSCTGKLKKE